MKSTWKTILDLLKDGEGYTPNFLSVNFDLKEVQFLGHRGSTSDGIHGVPSKVESVKHWKLHESLCSLEIPFIFRIGGLLIMRFLRISSPGLAKTPLTLVALPDGPDDFVVYCDASKQGQIRSVNPHDWTEVGSDMIMGPVALSDYVTTELSCVYDTFHVSNLKKCLVEPDVQVPLDEID
ncbi:hypothetical protein Tco_0845520 [Tanacetum coccineum]